MQQRYEHKIVDIRRHDVFPYRVISELEKDGWEVCGTLSDTSSHSNPTTDIIFKRPVKTNNNG